MLIGKRYCITIFYRIVNKVGRNRIGKKLYTNVRKPLAEQIEQLAANEGRTVSEMIAVLLEEAVKNRL
jgi:hypothetical protein